MQQRAFSERMSRERERLEPAVSAFRKVEAERNLWRERAGLLEGYRNRNAHLLAALADLSLVLPMDSMVRLFNLEDGVVRIQGTSGQAAALPRILEDSRYFREVELVSGITRDSKGRESYNIQARLEDPLALAGGAGSPNPGSRAPQPLADNPGSAEVPPAPAEVSPAPAEVSPAPTPENAPEPEAPPAPPSENTPQEATP